MEKLKEKMKETDGATVFHSVVLFLVFLYIFAIGFEYLRVSLVVSNIKSAYERAVRTVTVENYNETYAGFREEVLGVGGQYIGGPEGGGEEAVPEWEELHDTGDIENELIELLDLQEDENALVNVESGYTLSDFKVQVKDAVDSELHRYEVVGELNLSVAFGIGEILKSQVQIPIQIQTKYSEKY